MRRLVLAACLVGALIVAAPAHAENIPADPAPGETFDTTEFVNFAVDRTPDDPPWVLLISSGDGGSGGTTARVTLVPDDVTPDWAEVDMSGVASRYNQVGRFSWWTCEYDPFLEEAIEGTCTAPRPFSIRFRLSELLRGDVITYAHDVFEEMTGARDSGVDPRCRKISRSKQTCRVAAYQGDTLFYGRVTIWSKRPRGVRAWDRPRYSASLRVYDEYCHQVDGRPLAQCDRPYKRRSGWMDVSR